MLSIMSQLTSGLAIGHEATTSLIPRALQSNIINCNADQTAWINQALRDAQTLARSADPFLPPKSSGRTELIAVPDLETRYFGSSFDQFDFKPTLIHNFIANISRKSTSAIGDWWSLDRITISCKDIQNSNSVACENKVGNRVQKTGAYALSEHGKPEIVMCPTAFAKDASRDGPWHFKSLADRKASIDKNPD